MNQWLMEKRRSVMAVTSLSRQSAKVPSTISQESPMTKTAQTIQTGLARILARFGRKSDQQNPWRANEERTSRWYDCDVSSRGL
jgi:hypothetical protein